MKSINKILPTNIQGLERSNLVKELNITTNGILFGFGYLYLNNEFALRNITNYLTGFLRKKFGKNIYSEKEIRENISPDGWKLKYLEVYYNKCPLLKIESPTDNSRIFRITPIKEGLTILKNTTNPPTTKFLPTSFS